MKNWKNRTVYFVYFHRGYVSYRYETWRDFQEALSFFKPKEKKVGVGGWPFEVVHLCAGNEVDGWGIAQHKDKG